MREEREQMRMKGRRSVKRRIDNGSKERTRNVRRMIWNPLVPLLLGIASIGMIKIGGRVPSFTIEDQHERKWSRSDFTSKPVLYVLCDRDAYDHVDNWTKTLVPKYRKSIHFVPVADVRGVPGIMKGYVRGRFRDEFSYPILLDWEGDLTEKLGLKAGYPTLVITTPGGTVTYHAWGTGTDAQVGRLARKLKEVTE